MSLAVATSYTNESSSSYTNESWVDCATHQDVDSSRGSAGRCSYLLHLELTGVVFAPDHHARQVVTLPRGGATAVVGGRGTLQLTARRLNDPHAMHGLQLWTQDMCGHWSMKWKSTLLAGAWSESLHPVYLTLYILPLTRYTGADIHLCKYSSTNTPPTLKYYLSLNTIFWSLSKYPKSLC